MSKSSKKNLSVEDIYKKKLIMNTFLAHLIHILEVQNQIQRQCMSSMMKKKKL